MNLKSKRRSFNLLISAILYGTVCLVLSGCTGLFFFPSQQDFPYLADEKVVHERLQLTSADGTRLAAMRLPPPAKPIGVALQFHGNAQNMTSHYRFLSWLPEMGWEVLTFDYRGYGKSDGKIGRYRSDLEGFVDDGVTALKWANDRALELGVPLVIFGQSLGGNLALRALTANKTSAGQLRLLVIDSSFYSFTSIAREKLAEMWLTWPFQWVSYVLVSDHLSAGPKLETFDPKSLPAAVFLHSETDPVVSNHQGVLLHNSYPGEKVRWTVSDPGHMNAMSDLNLRKKLIERLRTLHLHAN
ncbi:MAG: alpha/beta fold hydrolase [Deltaproteobacteria bacterium]|nr:alpha/beta fold hydrolase [Deltaproteobacteria bacterium]